MNDTQRMLIKMLKENTGTHFLDSGMSSNRNWQRNQSRKFLKEPVATLQVFSYRDKTDVEHIDLNVELSTFHFLSDALEYDSHNDKAFQTYAKRKEFEDEGWLSIAETWASRYAEQNGNKPTHTFNSYNGESYLSQTIQGVTIGESDGLILLQLHGGCDVRGGYTKPRVFRWDDSNWERSLMDIARASVYCGQKHGWSIEPGYTRGWNTEPKLDSFPHHILKGGEAPQVGMLCANEDHAYCPLCATELQAGY